MVLQKRYRSLPNAKTVCEVPLTLEEQGIGNYIVSKLSLKTEETSIIISKNQVVNRAKTKFDSKVTVGVEGKIHG